MLNIYKTVYEIIDDNNPINPPLFDTIAVLAWNTAEALEKTKAKIIQYEKEYPMYQFKIKYGPKKRKEFNPRYAI